MPRPELTQALLQKYPTRNDIWCFHHHDASFSAEASTLDANGGKDPWNRELRLHDHEEHRDRDRDITHWTAYTTLAGKKVYLTIWND